MKKPRSSPTSELVKPRSRSFRVVPRTVLVQSVRRASRASPVVGSEALSRTRWNAAQAAASAVALTPASANPCSSATPAATPSRSTTATFPPRWNPARDRATRRAGPRPPATARASSSTASRRRRRRRAASVRGISTPLAISFADVERAAARIAGIAHRTPVLRSRTLDDRIGARVALKAEGLQRVGAFKFRGAYNAVAALSESQPRRGVCAASSGNHAQALALAARLCGTHATILMPHDAPPSKRAATEAYGAEVIAFDRYSDDRERLMAQLAAQRALHVVHPYDEPLVMAGAGTTALELFADAGDLDVLVVPVGGGGLVAGCATVAASRSPATRVVGVEPRASDDVMRSKRSGRRERVSVAPTIADGQQLPTPGERTWPIIDRLVDDVVTVSDEQIVAAMTFLFERLKVVAEPSGASALAAVLGGVVPVAGLRVGVVLSGANIDAARFAALIAGPPTFASGAEARR